MNADPISAFLCYQFRCFLDGEPFSGPNSNTSYDIYLSVLCFFVMPRESPRNDN